MKALDISTRKGFLDFFFSLSRRRLFQVPSVVFQAKNLIGFQWDSWPSRAILPSIAGFTLLVFCLGAGVTLAVENPPLPFDPKDMRHGFSKFDSMPTLPPDSPSDSMPSRETLAPDSPELADESPKGLFISIQFAEGFEEDLVSRRVHRYYAVQPTENFQTDARAVFIVFRVHQHLIPYQIIGRLYPDQGDELPAEQEQWVEEDTAYLALEDESGYLKFFPPSVGWKSGTYRADIYVGYEASAITFMGTMRFKMTPSP